ncbi:hypothetical protein PSTG_10054 [Puccinia striiformis f. sp. tritici PST-78]|uniref:Uncharacterized protein n=1 Tax=Puccinia striiformis f. sp. tritici PST-78 TaxID=1165861 RepID=A0A0L0VBF8_9BASI|nr:hypothetical protein PSTG_10054 [Puccinia striiformis f. sp. tritici PST-78]
MPEPGQGYQFKTKDQRMMKAICSFNLFYMGQNTKVPGLEGKRKAQNPIDVDEKTQIKKSWKNQYSVASHDILIMWPSQDGVI